MIKKSLFKNLVFVLYLLVSVWLVALFVTRTNFVSVNIETISRQSGLLVFVVLVVILLIYSVLFRLHLELKKWAFLGVLVLMILLTFSLPIFSVDIGQYLISSKNLVIYHLNPYLTPINQIRDDPWVKYMGSTWWMNYPSAYGPIALILSSIPVIFFSNNFYIAIVGYKLLVLVSIMLSLYLFRELDPDEHKTNTLLFALNPILLFSVLLDGHNDAFVLLSVLAFWYFAKQNKYAKSFFALLAGIFVKFTSAILLPSLFIEDKKINWKKAAVVIASTIIVFCLFLLLARLNFHTYFSNKGLIVNKSCIYTCTPLVSLIKYLFGDYADLSRLIIFAVVYAAVIIKYLFVKNDLLKFTFWAFMALFFVGFMAYLPWYAICPIAAGMLIEDKKYKYFVFVLTAYSLLFYFGI